MSNWTLYESRPITSATRNWGYHDKQDSYVHAFNDHVAYRYQVLNVVCCDVGYFIVVCIVQCRVWNQSIN